MTKPFLITCDGRPFAPHDTLKEAQAAYDMYSEPRPSAQYRWGLNENGVELCSRMSATRSIKKTNQ